MSSPTQRSLARLKKAGWQVQVVERWNAFARKRIDLFGCIDIVAVHPVQGIYGIQCTSGDNVAHHIDKCLNDPVVFGKLHNWLRAGGKYELHGWRKVGKKGARKKYEVRCVPFVINSEDVVEVLLP